ncbi:hypothetical protein JW992_16085 [candidate division KSB1 bacterium]|nr:hypothetical protein [candidate division KSB1 bacterium]
MNSLQFKSLSILLVTLLIGGVIGFFTGRLFWATSPEQQKIGRLGDAGAFMRMSEALVDPTDAQRDTIRAISKRYFSQLQETSLRHRTELRAIVDSMRTEMEPVLTPEQLEKIKHHREQFKRERMDRHHPEGGQPPWMRERGEPPLFPPPPPPGE